jgi:hypothetical protein
MVQTMADRLVQHLERSGFVLMKYLPQSTSSTPLLPGLEP